VEPGPWLILGRQGDWYRVQPYVWFAAPGNVPAYKGRLATTYHPGQGGTVEELVGALAADARHPDWPAIHALTRLTEHVPAAALDILPALARSPDAAALAALRAEPADLTLLWRALESLAFSWRSLPRTAWERAVRRLVSGIRAEVADLPEGMISNAGLLVREHVDAAVRRVSGQWGSLEPLLALAVSRELGAQVPQRAAGLQTPAFRLQLLAGYRAEIDQAPLFAPGAVPIVDGLDALVDTLASVPGGDLLLTVRSGPGNHERLSIRAAPALVALAALTSHSLTAAQQVQLRAISDLAPDWFDHVHHLAFLYALGGSHATALAAHGALAGVVG
jgi:hypothetical protein